MGSEWFERDSDYVLLEGQSTEELQAPLKRSTRLKYNCVSVSKKLVAFGSNTGGIYIFSRKEEKLLQIAFAEKETNSVSLVRISPHEKYVAFVSSSNIYVLDLKLESRSKAETLRSSSDLAGCLVTSLLWDQTSTKLFIGDDLGKVSLMPVYSNKAKNLFSLPLEVIMKLDSAIVQLDKAEDKILVSTLTRCYLCDTVKQNYSQIGKKLRDGSFGACFLQQGSSAPMIYSARPGSRIWEVDFEGNVLNTHQFKQLLAVPPCHIIQLDQKYKFETETYKAQSVAFPKLIILKENFLLTWTKSSVYVLDPINVKVILWTNQFSGIQDICCLDEEIYIFFESMKLQCISLQSVTSVIPRFIQKNDVESAANLCIQHWNVFLYKHVRKKFGLEELRNIYDKLVEEKIEDLTDKFHEVIVNIENKMADDSEMEESSSGRSRSGSAISGTSVGSMLSIGTNSAINGTSIEVTETVESDKEVKITPTKIAQGGNDINQNLNVPDGGSKDDVKETNDKSSSEKHFSYENEGKVEAYCVSETCKGNKNVSDDTDKDSLTYRNNFDDNLEEKDSGIVITVLEENESGCINKVDKETENTEVVDHVNGFTSDKSDNVGNEKQLLDEQARCEESGLNENTVQEHTCLKESVPTKDHVFETFDTHNHHKPYIHVSESPVAIVTDDVNDELKNEDEKGYLPVVTQGPRRLSLTSLSSVDSAEIHLDQPFPNDFDEVSDTIAIPVKRKSGKKKVRSRRHSAFETGESKSEVRMTRSMSVGTQENKDKGSLPHESAPSSLKEEDSISLYSNDSVVMEETSGSGKDTPDGLCIDKNVESLSVGSPSSISGEFSHSGEFTVSVDSLQNEEYTPRESTLSHSWEKGKSSSAPRKALQQLRNKMQTKVTSGTKNLIRNIKEKNLLSKAKEFAENLSQGSEAYLQSGDVLYNDNPDILMMDTEPDVKDSMDQIVAEPQSTDDLESNEKAIVDYEDLKQITLRTKETLQDLEIVTNPEAVYAVLLDWVTVLNKTFQEFHLIKYKDLESESLKSTGSKVIDCDTVVTEGNFEPDQNVKSGDTTEPKPFRSDCDTGVAVETMIYKSKHQYYERNSETLIKILSDKDFCYLSDPLCLPKDLFQDVSELTQACFDVACHGDILNFIKFRLCDSENLEKNHGEPDAGKVVTTIDEMNNVVKANNDNNESFSVKHNSSENERVEEETIKVEVENKTAIENESAECCETDQSDKTYCSVISDFSNKSNIDEKSEERITPNCIEKIDKKKESAISTTDSGERQVEAMAFFVRCYFPYLNVGRIREETVKGKSCYELWSALVTCMEGKARYDGEKYGVDEKSIMQHLLRNEEGTSQGAMLLGHISNLFRSKPDFVVDICVRCHPSIHALDVMYMCKYHQVPVETVFKQYMVLVTLNETSTLRKQVLADIGNHWDTCIVLLNMLLSEDTSKSAVMDENGCPRCMGHKVRRKNEVLIDQLINNIHAASDQQIVLEILRKHGYWVGVLKLLKMIGPRLDLLDLVLQLGDIDLLNGLNDLGYEPHSVSDWQRVLAAFHQKSEARNQTLQEVSCDWSKLITWTNLAILLVRNLGSEEAISLLEKLDLPEGVLSKEFYQICLLSGMVQKQQRSVLHSMLEKVDSYLWSYRPTAITPQVQYLALSEKNMQSGDMADSNTDLLHSLANSIKAREMSQTSVEDPECHWGIENRMNLLCPCCLISLRETVSHEEPGVLIFKCGHGFHKLCLPKRECMICDSTRQEKTEERAFYI